MAFAADRAAFAGRIFATIIAAWAVLALATQQATANPLYAAIVIDAKTGETLFARNADAARFPASLTKMMTLYITFEAMANGRINANSRVPFSSKAAAEPPTKIGLRPGATISVDEAIRALIVRSANDASTALAEFLGGSEARFAEMMTTKARALGMNSTTFRNAHGLPNAQQRTTARDMALLSLALREHFPQYYSYFSIRSATVAGKTFNSHNRVLGRVNGADGLKTGFIRSSGFNLATSVQANGRSVVAVVMGGRSGRSRDDHMVALLREHLPRASTRGNGGLIAARGNIAPTNVVAAAGSVALPGANAPIPAWRPETVSDVAVANAYVTPSAPVAAAANQAFAAVRPSEPIGEEAGQGDIDLIETMSTTSPIAGWVIQIASVGSESEAMSILKNTAARQASILGQRTPFTEEFTLNGARYHRARYAGFSSKDAAWNACSALKKSNIECYAVMQH